MRDLFAFEISCKEEEHFGENLIGEYGILAILFSYGQRIWLPCLLFFLKSTLHVILQLHFKGRQHVEMPLIGHFRLRSMSSQEGF